MSAEHPTLAQTPTLDSGVLPQRRRGKVTLGSVIGFFCGILFGLSMVRVVGEQASGSSNIAMGVLLFLAALSTVVLIHELGHLTVGWCLRFRFSSISVGPFALRLELGRLKLSLLREMTALGYAGMHVDTVVRLRRRLLLYSVAGAAANLITVPIAVLFANHTFFAATHPSFLSFAAQLAMISILLSVLSLLPIPLSPTSFTDGFRIATLLKDRARARRLLSIGAVGAQQQNGKRAKHWKQTWLKAASSVCDDSIDDFWGNLLAYISCSARKDDLSGAVHLERCLCVSRSLTHTVRDLVAQEAAIFSAWFRRDALLAEKWLKQLARPQLMQPLNKLRVDIAIRCACADFEAALRTWAEGLAYIQALPETATKGTLIDGWQEWRKQIQERQAQPVAASACNQS